MDQDVRYTAVSSFIFLRFFAPAILSPNLFHLRPHHPVSHKHMLMPCIHMLINLISFSVHFLAKKAFNYMTRFSSTVPEIINYCSNFNFLPREGLLVPFSVKAYLQSSFFYSGKNNSIFNNVFMPWLS